MIDADQLPKEFLEEMKGILGEEYEQYKDSFLEEWNPGLRVNTLKLQPETLKHMVPWKLEPVSWTEKGFYYEQSADPKPSRHPFYYAGLYYLQEPSAMAPAGLLPVTPGDKVLDLCAAPGGKSTELASKLQGQGLLVSNDISCSRASSLLKNLELAGASNICVTSESPDKLAQVWPEFFDKILVDAPCSGEGMFRRDDSMIKDWVEKGPGYYGPLQRSIMDSAVSMLKPGGMLLYSTCTFSTYENEGTLQFVLDKHPDMELVTLDLDQVPGSCSGIGLSECMRLFPHRLKGEGHFLALLQKKGRSCSNLDETGFSQGSSLEKEKDLNSFLADITMRLDRKRIMIHQDHVYYMPQGLQWNLPLRFLRTGLLMGVLKKGRFEPSQALAMALKAHEYSNILCLKEKDERILRYLKGETIFLKEGEGPFKGWCLVAVEAFPLGWAKGEGMRLKNKYYPGWRWQ